MNEMENHIIELVAKAAGANQAHEAMQFAQAACNAANAFATLDSAKSRKP